MINCQKCGQQNNDDSVFCLNCGKRLQNSNPSKQIEEDNQTLLLFCHNCGKKITGKINFCPSCGTKTLQKEMIKPSIKTQSSYNGTDYTNQSVNANLFKGITNSIGGKLYFYYDYMIFKSHALNYEQVELKIEYEDIKKIEFINFYLNLVSNGLRVETKSGEDFKFVVWHRQEIKEFLDYKRI